MCIVLVPSQVTTLKVMAVILSPLAVILSGAKDRLVGTTGKRSFGCGLRMTTLRNQRGRVLPTAPVVALLAAGRNSVAENTPSQCSVCRIDILACAEA